MEEAAAVVARLGLVPLPREGGWFRETFRAGTVATPRGPRPAATAILYLATPASSSARHRLPGPETWFFLDGDPLEILLEGPDGRALPRLLGPRTLPVTVPGGWWQSARPAAGGRWSLAATAMAPGFDPADLEMGER